VYSCWTTVGSITLRRLDSWLKMKHVSHLLFPLIAVLNIYKWVDCKLVFLPPYSPDYNPIEQAFSSIKAFLRRHWMDKSLSIIGQACQNITFEKAAGYFRASGYIV
jgi:hypothetical protein